jgi:nucleotidyltransferase substrate binding protein (TIGR01987 family)
MQALKTLEKAITLIGMQVDEDILQGLKDSEIQRFEYSVDEFWKYLKFYLEYYFEYEYSLASPRLVLRESFQRQLITAEELEACLNMVDDRNSTSHGYRFIIAEKIRESIPPYLTVMRCIVDRIKPKKK